jgi:hypothetical protein
MGVRVKGGRTGSTKHQGSKPTKIEEITLMWEMRKENTFLAFSPVETLVGRGEQEEGEGDLEQEETPPRFLA